jgi:transcriptional regulator with XRE-family HTH domain
VNASDNRVHDGLDEQDALADLFETVFDLAGQVASRISPGEVDAMLGRTLREAGPDRDQDQAQRARRRGSSTAAPSTRITVRRLLGAELRRLREAKSIKLEEVADELGLAVSTLSRIETGKGQTRSAYLSAMLDLYGIRGLDQRQFLVNMARDGYRNCWWAAQDDVLPTGLSISAGLEAEASSMRTYGSQVVHDLLQTEDYARAVLAAVHRHQPPEEIDRLVAERMERQKFLQYAEPLRIWAILDESAIRRSIGPPELMRRQLNHLCDISQWPNVTVQVQPFSSGLHPGLSGSFAIIEFLEPSAPVVVYSEGADGQAHIKERASDVRAYVDVFNLLRVSALSPDDSVDILGAIARNCR